MKPDMRNIDEVVNRYLPSAKKEDMESDIGHVFQQLQSRDHAADYVSEEWIPSSRPVPFFRWRIGMVSAAAAVSLAVLAGTILWRQSPFAVVESVDGSLYRLVEGKAQAIQPGEALDAGETVRSNGSAGGTLGLADGSRVEMRSRSQLSLERADDGVRTEGTPCQSDARREVVGVGFEKRARRIPGLAGFHDVHVSLREDGAHL